MARAYTEPGKERIRRALLQKGREYFIKYGIKKTSVEDLTRAAGIAKGSFYKFFNSKEALFMAVHEESEARLQREMFGKLETISDRHLLVYGCRGGTSSFCSAPSSGRC